MREGGGHCGLTSATRIYAVTLQNVKSGVYGLASIVFGSGWVRTDACDPCCAKGWDYYEKNRWADDGSSFAEPAFADNIRRPRQLLQHRETCQCVPGPRRALWAT